jgi:hypothetical protein
MDLPFLAEPEPSCPCLFQPNARDKPSSVTTTEWLLPAPALIGLYLQRKPTRVSRNIYQHFFS